MSLTVINADRSGAGTQETVEADETVFVGSGVSVISTDDSTAIRGTGANASVVVSSGARVHGGTGGIYLDSASTANKSILIEAGGVVSGGSFGAVIYGNNSVFENHGQVSGQNWGYVIYVPEADGQARIENTGQIVSGGDAIETNPGSGVVLTIDNSGLIWGGSKAIAGRNGVAVRMTNTGELRGAVELGNLADLIANVGGTIKGNITMGDGDDTLRPGMAVEIADGGGNNDLLDFSGSGTVRVSLTTPGSNTGAAAGDTYTAFENIRGSLTGSDSLTGDGLVNLLQGQGGNDTLNGMAGADSLEGGAGNDRLDGGTGADTMLGGAGNDVYIVDVATDRVFETTTAVSAVNAGGTDTVLSGVSFNLDAAAGVRFVERLTLTGAGNTSATGNALANVLTGNTGNNGMNGGLGNDTLIGGAGSDTLKGGLGNDSLTGGTGTDFFVFNTALSASNIDRIADFSAGTDEIRIENAIFTGIASGVLGATRFVANASGNATTAAQRFIYETDTGKLFYDSNGSAAGGKIQFATLATNLALTHTDFFVI